MVPIGGTVTNGSHRFWQSVKYRSKGKKKGRRASAIWIRTRLCGNANSQQVPEKEKGESHANVEQWMRRQGLHGGW
jgi:hypothetical protein